MSGTDTIRSLPRDLLDRLPEIEREWVEYGLSTAPADRRKADDALYYVYKEAGLAPPIALWFGSPLSGAVAWIALHEIVHVLSVGKDLRRSAFKEIWKDCWEMAWDTRLSGVRSHAGDSIVSHVGEDLREEIAGVLGSHVGARLLGEICRPMRSPLWNHAFQGPLPVDRTVSHLLQLGPVSRAVEPVRSVVRVTVWDSLKATGFRDPSDPTDPVAAFAWGEMCGGQHDADWLFAWRVLGGLLPPSASGSAGRHGFMLAAQAAGWWWPMRLVALITERACRLRRDERGRPHSIQGPAIEYPDGWGVYSIHGVRVPARFVTNPEGITTADVLGARDVEVRREVLGRYGRARFLRDVGARKIHSDDFGTLYRAIVPGLREPWCMVEVVDARPGPGGLHERVFLRVPPGIQTARQAVAWTFAMDVAEYAPDEET